MAIAIFNQTAFVARYPEFSAVSGVLLSAYFAEATLYLDNTDTSRVSDVAQRLVLLNMLTAHVAALSGALNNGVPTGMVGRISSASEGSVSATAEYAAPANGTQAYFQQTSYGASFWAASARYRTMIYVGLT